MLCFNVYMDGCQIYGPFLVAVNIRCRIIIGNQKGTIIFTTTRMLHALMYVWGFPKLGVPFRGSLYAIRIIAFWGRHRGPLLENYDILYGMHVT